MQHKKLFSNSRYVLAIAVESSTIKYCRQKIIFKGADFLPEFAIIPKDITNRVSLHRKKKALQISYCKIAHSKVMISSARVWLNE